MDQITCSAPMDSQELVSKYIDAWNGQRPELLLGLMHQGATYFDAFWMEYCTGRDLEQYFRDTFKEEDFRYRQVGELIRFEHGVVFRYSAHEPAAEGVGLELYRGAEVLHLQDGAIITISDYYCMPTDEALIELAELATRRHGLTRYAKSGLGSRTALRFRNRLSQILDPEHEHLSPDPTVAELAGQIGCSVDQLIEVIGTEFDTNFDGLLDRSRARFAKKLLRQHPDPRLIDSVAKRAGYRSTDQLCSSFLEVFGETPPDYCRRQRETERGDRRS